MNNATIYDNLVFKTMKSKDIINYIIDKGGIIVSEKIEGGTDFYCRVVKIKKEQCNIKIGYLNLGDKEITISKTCKCNENWCNIPTKCLENF